LQFELNGQTYFLNFDPGSGRWVVYEPTRDGMLAVPVHDDGTPLVMPSALVLDATDATKVN
jgi:hypothetical protein